MTQQDFILKAVAWTGLFVPGLTTRLSSRVSLINSIAVDSLTLKVLCSLSWAAGSMARSPLPRIYVQQTLALVKPDVVYVADQIEDQILNSGFTILQVSPCLEVVTCMSLKRDVDQWH